MSLSLNDYHNNKYWNSIIVVIIIIAVFVTFLIYVVWYDRRLIYTVKLFLISMTLVITRLYGKKNSGEKKFLQLTGESDAGAESLDPRSAAACLYM